MNLIYVPGSPCAIDAAVTNEHGETMGLHSGQTLRQIRASHPAAQVGNEDEFIASQEGALTGAPEPISREAFYHALAAMPPLSWHSSGRGAEAAETFTFGELISGNIGTLYVRLGEDYWRLQAVATLPHQAIIARVKAGQVAGRFHH